MANFVVRTDILQFRGRIVSATIPTLPVPMRTPTILSWGLEVKPDAASAVLLTSRHGITNATGTIRCQVNVDHTNVPWQTLLQLWPGTANQIVHVVGTWCDDDDSSETVIAPVGMIALEYPIEFYDIDGWPTAVRDYDLLALANARASVVNVPLPHEGESRTLFIHLPSPRRPTATAIDFGRAYLSTEHNSAQSVSFGTSDTPSGFNFDVTVRTGDPASEGFYAVQIGLTFEEPDLDNYCPPGTCEHDGKHCVHDGVERYMLTPPYLALAQTGDLVVSPGDGAGLISGIVAALSPSQVFDHMGIVLNNGRHIRHCTSVQERVEDEDLYTTTISVRSLGIDLEDQKIPLTGIRPDLIRYGWPGAITQTVEEVFQIGRNSLNARWSYAAIHPGEDTHDPTDPAKPFRLYQLPRGERVRRIQFNDPERTGKAESIIRLQEAPVTRDSPPQTFTPMLIHPPWQLEASARPALESVAHAATKISAHYRFFAYTRGDIGLDPAFNAPPATDLSWATLPQGASWPAGTIGAMCSSFVWTAVQKANADGLTGSLPIMLEDRFDPPNPATGLEYGAKDGLYQYHEAERIKSATRLVGKLRKKVQDRFDQKIEGAFYDLWPQLQLYRAITSINVANQVANVFAGDKAEDLSDSWTQPGEGETVSPDDTLNFWDLKPGNRPVAQPEGKLTVYGDASPVTLTAATWARVPLFRKLDTDPGKGQVTVVAMVAGVAKAGVTVSLDFGCVKGKTTDNRERPFTAVLESGRHFAEGFILLPNPLTLQLETFRVPKPVPFDVDTSRNTTIVLDLQPPSDLWRVIDVHLDADIHDRSFFGGDADHKEFHDDRHFELRQDLDDDPMAPEDQRNTKLQHTELWWTEPEVGSGVHVAVRVRATLNPGDRSVTCDCVVVLLDTDDDGVLTENAARNVDQIERRTVTVPAGLPVGAKIDALTDVDFASDETVPERARVTLWIANRARPV